MHVDAPVSDLVMDEPLLEDGGLLKAGKPEDCASIDAVERFEGSAVPVADVIQLPSHHLVEAMMTTMTMTTTMTMITVMTMIKKMTTSSE